MIRFEFKKRDEKGRWNHLDVSVFARKTLREVFHSLEGQEIVAEFMIDGQRCFFCGNQYWHERMQRKGVAVRFDEAIERLQKSRPEILDQEIPTAEIISEVFTGATVEKRQTI